MSDPSEHVLLKEKPMSVHTIDDLVRTINPATFSESAHGAGHRVVLVDKRAGPYKKSMLGGIFSRHDELHYFVKKWTVPKEVKGWMFRWSEGTTAISLDFEASFIVQANEDTHAYGLVEALSLLPSPGEALYNLIHGVLTEELNRMLDESNRRALSLLDLFRRSSVGVGESEQLNAKVGERVRSVLGGAMFRIGLQLLDAPPMQVEVRRTGEQADPFVLADSRRPRVAETTALLKLENYQAFKKSELHTEDKVSEAIGHAIAQIVKEQLFGRRYYEVVGTFSQGVNPIKKQMRDRIDEEAAAIGYGVKMFQTLPDIAALKLLEPLRIDIAASEEKYDLKNSIGYVQFSLSLMTQAGPDISRLHLLIDPDSDDVAKSISAHVRQVCRDTVQRFDHFAFNLHFEDTVVPQLSDAIIEGLSCYGLSTQIINIRQAPTEEALRFKAIRSRTIDFEALIKPHANRTQADAVPVAGTIEVVGTWETGWELFQSKDFGFSSDSHVRQQSMRTLADRLQIAVPPGNWSDTDRRSVAIDLELAEIRERVKRVLEGRMAMGPDLAEHWTTASNNEQIAAWAEKLAANAIRAEFGLSIEIRAFRRLDTEMDKTAQITRQANHDVVREAALDHARRALAHERDERAALDSNYLALIESLGRREREALEDEVTDEGRAIAERLRKEIEQGSRRPRTSSDSALAALQPKRNRRETIELPWVSDQGGEATDSSPDDVSKDD